MSKSSHPTPLLGPEPWKTIRGVPFVTWDLWLMVMSGGVREVHRQGDADGGVEASEVIPEEVSTA